VSESRDSYFVTAGEDEQLKNQLNFFFERMSQRLDQIEGHRDTPTFYKNEFKFPAGDDISGVFGAADGETAEFTSDPSFDSITLNDLTASKPVFTDANKTLVSTGTQPVDQGGTSLATITDHAIMLGSGTAAVTPLGPGTNGQIPIGSTGADPVMATISGTANQIAVTNGPGSSTISIPNTDVTGLELEDLTDGGDTTLHDHDGISENTTHRGSNGTDHSDVGLNNTHRGSNGTDHSYIGQDVTTSGDPTFDTVTLDEGHLVFPGTANPSADTNTLDDYEEGTWTLGVTFGGGSTGLTTDLNAGEYTKIGRQVSISGYISFTNKGSSSGIALLTGLPFTNGAATSHYTSASLRLTDITFANQYMGYVNVSSTTIVLEEVTEGGTKTALTDANFANNSTVLVNATYFVD